jgi:hypothetical protein
MVHTKHKDEQPPPHPNEYAILPQLPGSWFSRRAAPRGYAGFCASGLHVATALCPRASELLAMSKAKKWRDGQKQRKRHERTKTDRASSPPSPFRVDLRSRAGKRGAEIAWSLVRPIVFFVSFVAVIKLFVNTPVGERFAAVAACLAVIYDVFDIVNWKRAALLRQKRLWPLLGNYILWFLAMVAVAVVGFSVPAGSWQGLLVVVAFLLVALRRARVEEDICTQFETLGVSTPEPIWGKTVAERVDDLVSGYAARKSDDSPRLLDIAKRAIASWIRARPISPHHDGRRVVAAVVIAAAVLFTAWTGIVWAVFVGKRGVHEFKVVIAQLAPSQPSGNTKSHSSKDSTGRGEAALEAPSPSSNAGPVIPERTTSPELINECPTPLVMGGPPWMLEALSNLYLGGSEPMDGEAPGTSIAGCPSRLHLSHTHYGLFAYTLGKRPASTETPSIAVDSTRFGPALFLAPAVRPVLALVRRFRIVGGIHRFGAGSGQFYPVQTPAGTYILIRRETGTERVATPYMVLPPVVAQAWSLAITRSQAFFWPVPKESGGRLVYDFYSDTVPSHVAYTFAYQSSSSMSEPELSETELQADAHLAG